MGNFIAQVIIEHGQQDGSNEAQDYRNRFYNPVNKALFIGRPGSQNITDPNRWQPLLFNVFIDQSGNEIPDDIPPFLSPEWGDVIPFALGDEDKVVYEQGVWQWQVYHDPGNPCFLYPDDKLASEDYKWGFELVARWSAHLDSQDGVMWDISPASIGNLDLNDFPNTIAELPDFYQEDGGDPGTGYNLNPKTGLPYEPQMVPRGDYARVLAEFWADGPDSETPPGHWFTILNYVNDHPEHTNRFEGQGDELDQLEWDVKAYFALGGAMHDAAISAWSIKGYYDYIRPISAIRYMSDKGQASDPNLPNYHIEGINLVDGYIELVTENDSLAGDQGEHIGKIKVKSWKGHEYISNTETDQAGVAWILAENWWPYQRLSFVTPPFAGYVSGHSTFSRAAAEILTLLTGDAYFPGGMGEFLAKKDDFLVFEEGPSMDIKLQWAKYYDASDQCSLSRIWGGIHPPVDDIFGRQIGQKVGVKAFDYAKQYFEGNFVTSSEDNLSHTQLNIYPNPISSGQNLEIQLENISITHFSWRLINSQGTVIQSGQNHLNNSQTLIQLDNRPSQGIYFLKIENEKINQIVKIMIQ